MATLTKPTQKKSTKISAKSRPTRRPSASIQVSTCQLVFPFSISQCELVGFRGAILHAVTVLKEVFVRAGIATDLFHNHDEAEENRQLIRQPLVAYQLQRQGVNGRGFPCLSAAGAGAKAIALLAACMPSQLRIYNRHFDTMGFTLEQQQLPVQPQKIWVDYALHKWLALNPDNYTSYKNDLRFTARVQLLNGILKKNIRGWYEAAGNPIPEKKLQVFITEITAITHDGAEHNGRRMFVFNCTFAANMALPPCMALGNGAAWGFGKVLPLKSTAAHIIALQHTAAVL